MGFGTTLLTAWLGARWGRKTDAHARLLEARVRVYGDCAEALYEYERATHNRVKARIKRRRESVREPMRQEAYRCNARARAVIGQAAILARREDVARRLETVRAQIGDLNNAGDNMALRALRSQVEESLELALRDVRRDLVGEA